MFELSSDFDERVLVKVQGECKKKFELSGFHCICATLTQQLVGVLKI